MIKTSPFFWITALLCLGVIGLSILIFDLHNDIHASLMQQQQLYPLQGFITSSSSAESEFLPRGLHSTKKADDYGKKVYEDIELLRQRLPPSIWTVATRRHNPDISRRVGQLLNSTEVDASYELCGNFLYSTIQRAVQVEDMGEQTFVATGDISSMWLRDSAIQSSIYFGRMGIGEIERDSHVDQTSTQQSSVKQLHSISTKQPYLRLIVEGAIRRQAFNILQDPYANAYAKHWKDPDKLDLKDRVIGRGGWVDTRNYEADSGAYFFHQLYDYFVADGIFRPEVLIENPMIFDAVMLMIHTYVVEQHHETLSPYRYFELQRGGKGSATNYTGMTWSGFRPSDDKCQYGYLVPANIHVAAGLERILELNQRIWKSTELEDKAAKLLRDIETGIQTHGIVQVPARSGNGMEAIYAYEVDGLVGKLYDFDDANVPSLLSIPLLGWSGYDHQVYKNTRARLLDAKFNKQFYQGAALSGMGSPHTPAQYVWPLAMAVEALTEEGSLDHVANVMVFQIRQSLASACKGAMHESVHSGRGCPVFTRPWFEWANAMFVVLIETALGKRCDAHGQSASQALAALNAIKSYEKKHNLQGGKQVNNFPAHTPIFYENKYKNDYTIPYFYQGVASTVKYAS